MDTLATSSPAKLYRAGDAFELLNTLDDRSVDLIITSPPYWGLRTYGQDHNWQILDEWEEEEGDRWAPPSYSWYREHGGVLGLEPLPDWYVQHLAEFFDLARSKLKIEGNLWVNIGDTFFARWSSIRDEGRQGLGQQSRSRRRTPMGRYLQEKQMLQIPARFAIAMQNFKWILRNDLIWHKQNVPPRPEKDRLRLSHEHFYHFVHKRTDGRPKYYYDLSETEERGLDVVSVNARPGTNDHSATFPRDLIEPRICSSCPPGGIVLDPFCGTGAAVEAAADLGRMGIGFEMNPQFFQTTR
mgnify:CR=1 FL=1